MNENKALVQRAESKLDMDEGSIESIIGYITDPMNKKVIDNIRKRGQIFCKENFNTKKKASEFINKVLDKL